MYMYSTPGYFSLLAFFKCLFNTRYDATLFSLAHHHGDVTILEHLSVALAKEVHYEEERSSVGK